MFRMTYLTLGILLATITAACSPQKEPLEQTRDHASATADQGGAADQSYKDIYEELRNSGCYAASIECSQSANERRATANSKLVAALSAHDQQAAEYISDEKVPNAVWGASSKAIIEQADSMLTDTSKNATVWLNLAGYLTEEGDYVPRNYERATLYYGASWLSGSANAAARAANVYNAEHDIVNAYLWALRCTTDCSGLRVDIASLEGSLDTPTIRLVQSKAADRSVMGL